MPKQITFTTSVALPSQLTAADVLPLLHDHAFILELNPLVLSYDGVSASDGLIAKNKIFIDPRRMSDHNHVHDDGTQSTWYTVTDQIPYLSTSSGASTDSYVRDQPLPPKKNSKATYNITYTASFIDLQDGVQTICHAPLGVITRSRWTLTSDAVGTAYLREDVDLRCSPLMAAFVKKTMKKAHIDMTERLMERAVVAVEKKRGTWRKPAQAPPRFPMNVEA